MASHYEANYRTTILKDESCGEEDSFEVLPPAITGLERYVESPKTKCRRRSEAKSSPSSRNTSGKVVSIGNLPWNAIIVLVLVMVLKAASLHRPSAPDNHIEELRLEFKRDIESLRSDVENDLVAHLLATAEVQTAAKQRVIEIELELEPEIEPEIEPKSPRSKNFKSSPGNHRLLFPMESEITDDPSTLGYDLRGKMGNGYRLLESQLKSMENLSSLSRIHDTIIHHLQTISMSTMAALNSTPATVLRHVQSIRATIVDSWYHVQNTIIPQLRSISIQNQWLHHAIEVFYQYRLEFFVWCTVCLMFLYNYFRYYSGLNDKVGSRGNNSLNPSEDREGSDECSENTSHTDGDGNLDPEERIEDVVMEHMFHESMAATGNGKWPIRVVRTHTGDNRASNNRHRVTGGGGSSSSGSINAQRNVAQISKAERRRRARINAQAFSARDMQRLAASGVARSTNVASSSPPRGDSSAREFAARDNQRLTRGGAAVSGASNASGRRAKEPPQDVAPNSNEISKKERLQQARANARLYAEQDKKRLQKVAAKRRTHCNI